MWIFGYGSLVWRPSLTYLERRPGYIEGWTRRFWQGSTDHRGVPGAPGRVVTLIESAGERCWGMGYRIDQEQQDEVLEELDYREKGGYERRWVELVFAGEHVPPVRALVYIATPENPNYLGPAPADTIAAQVHSSVGPSGRNIDYVLELAAALEEMQATDEHVAELARLLAARTRRRV